MGFIQSFLIIKNGYFFNVFVDKENMDEYLLIIWDIIKNYYRFVDILLKYEQIFSVKLDLVSVLEKY